MSGATDAVAVCQTWIEDCTPLVVPRALPAAPINVIVGAVNNINRFAKDFIEVRWSSGSTTNNIVNGKYKVEWDTVPTFNSVASTGWFCWYFP